VGGILRRKREGEGEIGREGRGFLPPEVANEWVRAGGTCGARSGRPSDVSTHRCIYQRPITIIITYNAGDARAKRVKKVAKKRAFAYQDKFEAFEKSIEPYVPLTA